MIRPQLADKQAPRSEFRRPETTRGARIQRRELYRCDINWVMKRRGTVLMKYGNCGFSFGDEMTLSLAGCQFWQVSGPSKRTAKTSLRCRRRRFCMSHGTAVTSHLCQSRSKILLVGFAAHVLLCLAGDCTGNAPRASDHSVNHRSSSVLRITKCCSHSAVAIASGVAVPWLSNAKSRRVRRWSSRWRAEASRKQAAASLARLLLLTIKSVSMQRSSAVKLWQASSTKEDGERVWRRSNSRRINRIERRTNWRTRKHFDVKNWKATKAKTGGRLSPSIS